jgi:hypothetical protein
MFMLQTNEGRVSPLLPAEMSFGLASSRMLDKTV